MYNTKKMRKALAFLLAVILTVSTLSISASAKSFSDVSSSHYALDGINYVSDNGFMSGTSSTSFSPNTTITRAMLVTVLYQKAGSPAVSGNNPFTDVSASAYYAKAVVWASSNGITSGTSSTTFSPNQNVTRQEAITLLYRFATKMGSDTSKTTSITGYSDYSSVSSYARTAMSWALGTNIIEGTSSTTLSPTSTMNRAQFALALTRYGTNSEKIVCGKDNLGFINSGSYFTTDKYYISAAHLNKLKSVIRAHAGANNVDSALKRIEDNRSKSWGGSCYGISVITALDKMGKIAFNENYSSGSKSMSAVSSLKGQKGESAINYYQLSYALPNSGGNGGSGTIASDVTAAVNSMMNSSVPTLFSHWWKRGDNTVGHTIIVNSCKKNGSSYTLDVCDPNSKTSRKMTLTADGKLDSTQLTMIRTRNDYSFYDKLDIDSYTNSDSTSNTAPTSAESDASSDMPYANDYSSIEVKLSGNFIIRSDSGDYLQWDGESLSGTMEVYEVRMSTEGEDQAASMFIDVPVSNQFYFENLSDNNEIWFSVADLYRYSRIKGAEVSSVSVDESGKMEIDGNGTDFDVVYGAPGEDMPLLKLTGTGYGHIVTENSGDVLKASGGIDNYTVQSIDSEGNLLYSETVTISQADSEISSSVAEVSSEDES